MVRPNAEKKRRRFLLGVAIASVVFGVTAWQLGPRQLALAQEVAGHWISGAPIGEIYSHAQDEYAFPQLGDVPQDNVAPDHIDPRSLGDTRVRQFDELDRPRFNDRQSHRAAQINEERFSVVAMTGEADAQLAKVEFGKAWDEFSKLADTFTDTHRNPDFGISQLLIVVDNEPIRERDEPKRTLQIQNGQTIVYINASAGEPSLEEQLPELRQGAVHALMHLAELDRKFPLWAQQGLAQYTAEKIRQREEQEAKRDTAADNAGLEQPQFEASEAVVMEFDREQYDDELEAAASPEAAAAQGDAKVAAVDVEYWRLQRANQDQLAESASEEESELPAALQRVTFLLEGDDAAHAPAFLLSLRALAEEPTDPLLASRAELAHTQLLPPATDTIIDALLEELEPAYIAWKADPLRGQPLFVPEKELADPAMLEREKEMEVVLKLALRQQGAASETDIRPRFTEFNADGLQETIAASPLAIAIDVQQLYWSLVDSDTPWAITDADGELVLWTDHDRLAEILGVEDHRYTTEYRDNHWVLVTHWDEDTQLEAWLEPNQENPSRPLVKFATKTRDAGVRVAELDAGNTLR